MTPRLRASPTHSVKDFSVADPLRERPVFGGRNHRQQERNNPCIISLLRFSKEMFLKNLNVYRDFHPNRFVLSQNAILPEQMIFVIALNAGAVWGEPLSPCVIVSCYVISYQK